MRTSKAFGFALAAAFGVAVLAGCSGGNSPLSPNPLGPGGAAQSERKQTVLNGPLDRIAALRGIPSDQGDTTRSFFNSDAKGKALIFTDNVSGSVGHVYIYRQSGKNKLVGEIANLAGPDGLATDAAANLYIAEDGGAKVGVYAPPYAGVPALTLDDTGWYPYDVAVSRQGIVGVANLVPVTHGNGSVTLYAKNSTTPCATITNPNFGVVTNDGFDDKGNLYIAGNVSSQGSAASIVGEIKGGCRAKKITLLTTKNSLSTTLAGVKVDKAGRIAILDEGNNLIDTYDPPKNGNLGAPISTTSLTAGGYGFAFRASGSDVYVLGGTVSAAQVLEYDYPVGGTAEKAFNVPFGPGPGVAVTPPLIP